MDLICVISEVNMKLLVLLLIFFLSYRRRLLRFLFFLWLQVATLSLFHMPTLVLEL